MRPISTGTEAVYDGPMFHVMLLVEHTERVVDFLNPLLVHLAQIGSAFPEARLERFFRGPLGNLGRSRILPLRELPPRGTTSLEVYQPQEALDLDRFCLRCGFHQALAHVRGYGSSSDTASISRHMVLVGLDGVEPSTRLQSTIPGADVSRACRDVEALLEKGDIQTQLLIIGAGSETKQPLMERCIHAGFDNNYLARLTSFLPLSEPGDMNLKNILRPWEECSAATT